ncbi:hypothetical protein [Bacteroides thetaiotaomicron]|uniref:hypothetical protein n=1 Tax=Bacteroides thetaiotaomicron TaxID=818 RepID=UPI001F18B01C|nr:hypothetical protein [Bacteroides thetaiotaomicron]MCE8781029.1 hypothetical protein [Bacteroides thetaiotaomicron]
MENDIQALLKKNNFSVVIEIFQRASEEEKMKIILVIGAVVGTSVVLKRFYDFLKSLM